VSGVRVCKRHTGILTPSAVVRSPVCVRQMAGRPLPMIKYLAIGRCEPAIVLATYSTTEDPSEDSAYVNALRMILGHKENVERLKMAVGRCFRTEQASEEKGKPPVHLHWMPVWTDEEKDTGALIVYFGTVRHAAHSHASARAHSTQPALLCS
jgi:hypothetical protein